MHTIIDFILHIDTYLSTIISTYGMLTYLILFLIIFCETGLVITPFLPGDSLIFATGAFCAMGLLSLPIAFIVLFSATILGNTCNYIIGNKIGHKIHEKNTLNLNKNIDKTEIFFKKHGGKAVIISRFMPIIRTFVPFVAGMSSMDFKKFSLYNIIGGFSWVFIAIFSGFFFGTIPYVKNHFSLIMLAIICVSLIPIIIVQIKAIISHTKAA